ncbi:Nuclear transcription factor Y subunit C-2 [Abeliophyllum distichum]|uniref:Nuclear transcription factor Y subunit C-2 n=1 Tax=Abeliophyllum distichum TaxID=126358 RepID=A0ABD1SUJ4_9LAMI
MDFNHSIQFPSSNPPSKMHNFMHMPPYFLDHSNQDGEARSFRFRNLLRQNMLTFWNDRLVEIRNPPDVRSQHLLPLARIKKIMKSDEEVKMISADTPILFAKACEIFIMELTLRAWMNTEDNKRRTMQRFDVAKAIRDEELLDFLTYIVPFDGDQEEAVADCPGDTHQCTAYPMNLCSMNSDFLMRSQEEPQHLVFPPSFSSAETKYHKGFN